jgi:hypothetical protein
MYKKLVAGRLGMRQQLTTSSEVHLEKLIAVQLVKKFPILYETQRFSAVFTKAYH